MKIRLLASLFALLTFLFMANPCFGDSGREMVVVFKGNQTEVLFEEDDGTTTKRKPLLFSVPAFVGGIFNGKELLTVLCESLYSGFSDVMFIGSVFKTSYGDYTKWSDSEVAVKNTLKNKTPSSVGEITAVIKGNKIYALALSTYASSIPPLNHEINTEWEPLMIVGIIMNRTESGSSGVYVKWEKEKSLKSLLPITIFGVSVYQFFGGIGNGVVTKNGIIVFPIRIYDIHMNSLSTIMYSTDDGSTWKIGGETKYYTTDCSVTEWGDGKLLLSVRYNRGFRLVYESDDMGTTWKESLMLSRVWGNQPDRKEIGSQGSLITVPVDGKDVLLFSHPLNKKGNYKSDTLQLWMSDGQRILCVGTISEDDKEERSGYSILAHVGDHLYVVHEINPYESGSNYSAELKEWDKVIALSSLSDLFKRVKKTFRAWQRLDKELKKKNIPTNGLVGFLADNKNNTVWEDEYNCVNANVNSATRVHGGFRFDGKEGSGAKWPVQSQGQNQVYIFTKKQFTLTALVMIHSMAETGDHSVLGASMDAAGKSVMIGLWYRQDNNWYFMDADGLILKTGVSFDLEKEYHVAITYANLEFSVYLDGVFIRSGRIQIDKDDYIKHFFMGGIGKSSTAKGCLCTVKNVMLFSQVLNQTEVNQLENVVKYVNHKESTSTTTPTITLENSEPSSTMYPKETSDPGTHIIPYEDENDETEISDSKDSESSAENPTSDNNVCDGDFSDFQNHSNDGYSQKGHKRGDGAVETISSTAWIFIVYSYIVLVVF